MLAGFPWLPRFIDKVRAEQAGTLGEYLPPPCPGDQRFLHAIGVTADALKAQITGGADDAAIGAWVAAQVTPGVDERLAEFRRYLLAPSLPERQAALAETKDKLAAARPDLDLSRADSFIKLICVEEGHALPA
jgi:hypothetical protein